MNTINSSSIKTILSLIVICIIGSSIAYGNSVRVTLDTSPLIGGSYSMAFDFIGGSTLGDNTVIIGNFNFGGGSPSDNPSWIGGASGRLSSSITLADTEFLNSFTEGFAPGTFLAFDLDFTSNYTAGETPDNFAFYILDDAGFPIPTTDALASAFLVVESNPSSPTIQTFPSDSPNFTIAAPDVTARTPVPEPATLLLLGTGLGVIGLAAWRRKRA
jgi:hypothetical protein